MTDLRSGLCHGPYCDNKITKASASEDFCSDDCQTAWNALHALPPMPSLSIHLPAPAMARWTPEGGAPITPETSTWTPQPGRALIRYPDCDDLCGGHPPGFEHEVGECAGPTPVGGWVQLDDSDYPDWAWTDVTEYVSDAYGLEQRSTVALRMTPVPPTIHPAPGEPEHLLPGDRFRVEQVGGRWQYKIVEVGEAATQSPIQRPLSVMSRPWRWVWFRG